jgi:hypothetical protein
MYVCVVIAFACVRRYPAPTSPNMSMPQTTHSPYLHDTCPLMYLRVSNVPYPLFPPPATDDLQRAARLLQSSSARTLCQHLGPAAVERAYGGTQAEGPGDLQTYLSGGYWQQQQQQQQEQQQQQQQQPQQHYQGQQQQQQQQHYQQHYQQQHKQQQQQQQQQQYAGARQSYAAR